MSPQAKSMIVGALKSAAAIAIGATAALHAMSPGAFNITSGTGLVNLLKAVGSAVGVAELRYGWQWIKLWAVKNPAPPAT